MSRILGAAIALVWIIAAATPAAAQRAGGYSPVTGDWVSGVFAARDRGTARSANLGGPPSNSGIGPRPRKWCGWYMRTRHGGGPQFNVAWNWRKYGSPAAPQVGAIVVWRHHVGEIVGRAANGMWIVLSGNDGGRVRQRARSIAGALIRM